MRAILDIWSFRTFILGSIRREISSRYKGTVMGSAWVVINPLMMIIIYTVIFSQVMHSRLSGVGGTYSYSIFLCAGLLPWLFFSDLVSKCQGAFVDNGNLLKKMHFPRGCLLVIALGNAGFNFLVIFTIFACFLLLTGNFPGVEVFSIVPVMLLQILLSLGIGIFLATANVFFRDIGHIVGLLLQFGFWFTPIVYPLNVLPVWVQKIIQVNPLVGIFHFYQTVFVWKQVGDWLGLLPAVGWTVVMLLLGVNVYRQHQNEMVDEL